MRKLKNTIFNMLGYKAFAVYYRIPYNRDAFLRGVIVVARDLSSALKYLRKELDDNSKIQIVGYVFSRHLRALPDLTIGVHPETSVIMTDNEQTDLPNTFAKALDAFGFIV